MMTPDGYLRARSIAADLAVRSLAQAAPDMGNARNWADLWLGWLLAPQAISARGSFTVTDAHGHVTFQAAITDGGTMTTSMTMDDTATITGGTTDDHGDPTSDTLSFAGSDNGTVLTLAVSGNVCTITPVAEGEATVTQSDPAAPGVAALTYDITVGPGPTSQQTGTITVNTGANAAPPAAG